MSYISISNSPNISQFGFTCRFDIYNRKVTFDTSALTTYIGGGIGNVFGISFSLVDQNGITLALLDFTSSSNYIVPNITKQLVVDLSSLNYNFLFQTYAIQGAIQDQNGTVYTTPILYKQICQPAGIQNLGYVPGVFTLSADCSNNILSVKDTTVYTLNGSAPSSQSWNGTLTYPPGTISPVPFTSPSFSNNSVYTGPSAINCTAIAEYSLGDDVYEDVTYITTSQFNIVCDDGLANILCCLGQIQQTATVHCDDNLGKSAQAQLDRVSTPLMLAIASYLQGQDPSTYVSLISNILNCNCGQSSIGQNQVTPVNPTIYSIVINGANGVSVNTSQSGNTKTYTISSNLVQVVKGVPSDPAFTIAVNNTTGTTKYVVTFNYDALAGEVLTAIAADPSLIAQLNNLITSTGVSLLGLNGGCIINLSQTTYSLYQQISGITTVQNVVINGNTYNAPTNTYANNSTAVQLWLNSLGLGVFVATNTANSITINSASNPNAVSTMTFVNPNTTTRFIGQNANLTAVLQAIINYICGINTYQISLNTTLSLCMFDYSGNPYSQSFNTTQGAFNAGVAAAICNLSGQIYQFTKITCAQLQAIFSDQPNAVFNTVADRLLSVVGGACTTLSIHQLALAVINAVNTYTDVKNAWCAISCVTPGNCPDVAGFSINPLSNVAIGLYSVTWASAATASQTVKVWYRVHGTTTWTVAASGLSILANGTVSGTVPYVIPGLTPNTTYDIFIQNNCGGNGFIQGITTPQLNQYSGTFLVDASIYNICADSPVTLYSSVPFATGVIMYTNSGLTTPLTGYNFIASTSNGQIYAINSGTGLVGANTSNVCGSGISGTYILGNSTGTICSGTPGTKYTSGAFAVGGVLYNDSGLSSPVTGYSYVVNSSNNHIYNLNSSTGVIGSDTGLSCSSNTVQITSSMAGITLTAVTGITGFTPSPALPLTAGNTTSGTHSSFTGTIALTLTGSPIINPSNITLYVNGAFVQCINVTAAGAYTLSSRTYATSDLISIALNTGSC